MQLPSAHAALQKWWVALDDGVSDAVGDGVKLAASTGVDDDSDTAAVTVPVLASLMVMVPLELLGLLLALGGAGVVDGVGVADGEWLSLPD